MEELVDVKVFLCALASNTKTALAPSGLSTRSRFFYLIEFHDEPQSKKIMPKWGPKRTSSYISPHETRTCCAEWQFFDYVRVCFLTAQKLSWKNGQRTGLARNFARHRPVQHKTHLTNNLVSLSGPTEI
jgi:hypothetical protein